MCRIHRAGSSLNRSARDPHHLACAPRYRVRAVGGQQCRLRQPCLWRRKPQEIAPVVAASLRKSDIILRDRLGIPDVCVCHPLRYRRHPRPPLDTSGSGSQRKTRSRGAGRIPWRSAEHGKLAGQGAMAHSSPPKQCHATWAALKIHDRRLRQSWCPSLGCNIFMADIDLTSLESRKDLSQYSRDTPPALLHIVASIS